MLELMYELCPAPNPPILPPQPLIIATPGISGRNARTNAWNGEHRLPHPPDTQYAATPELVESVAP